VVDDIPAGARSANTTDILAAWDQLENRSLSGIILALLVLREVT
jgi:hypothetical protein